MISNWDFSLVLAIGELLVDPQQPSSLLDIKLHAFQKAKDLMLQYEMRGIRRDLLDVILDKKLKLILKASLQLWYLAGRSILRSGGGACDVGDHFAQQHANPAGSRAVHGSLYSRVRNHEGAAYKRPAPRREAGGAIGWISTSESIYSIIFKSTMSRDYPLLFPSLSTRQIPAIFGSSKSSNIV